ncbi:branched-chain amino acid ABC transporter substrate-binding protein [Alloalcanivorax sp. C16-2]|uniref:branched-chain amino acid ABC transporter substrate-binding protein n=1 Tax=Alloalcanivorax TaxID=3020832 RepID=UPI001932E2E5|nr:branched-chain amino acid ABC transporter substrate-binding protein [Alloalcanivorax marinus]MBL7251817.1 branched-chain amino acid ABC transporter substrate-binding protein [Alloalcanivorax marinus]
MPRWITTATAVAALGVISPAVQAEPLKIAIIESLSGPQTSTGRLIATAAEYVIDQTNTAGGFNGEAIQVKEYDNAGDTSGAATKFREAAADGAHVIIQGASSAIGGQVTEDVRKHNIRNPDHPIIYINVGAEAMELRGKKCHFHAFHFTTTAPYRTVPLMQVMSEQGHLGKRVYSINQNYSWGRDMETAIVDNADRFGYQVVDKVLHEVNRIQDFSPFVARIKSENPDSVITGNWSNDLLLLMKAVGDANLDVTFGTIFMDQPGNVANAGNVAKGHYVAHSSNIELLDEAGTEAYKKATGHYPVFIEPTTLNGVGLFAEALKKVDFEGGDINVDEIALAMENTTFDNGLGGMHVRKADHQAVIPIVVSQVASDVKYPVDGTELGFKPVKTVAGADAIYPAQDSCRMRRPE